MAKEMNFTSKSLYNKKFKTADRGYDPLEVDEVLDLIIEDYRLVESNSSVDIPKLLEEIARLKKDNAKLLDELNKIQSKIKYLPKDLKEVHIDNYELLQRIGKLEVFIKEKLNMNPDDIK